MGTRADFYIGRGENAKWIGSISMDGYIDGIPKDLLRAPTEAAFRGELEDFIAQEHADDFTSPEEGWPWPWDTSHLTDYSYAFDDGKVWACCFGYEWFDPLGPEPEERESDEKLTVFPTMKTDRKAPAGSAKSGIMKFIVPLRKRQ